MIEVQHLTKDYRGTLAVSDLSFEVGRGEVVGFLGPNGAGKTTTLRILAGFLGATRGCVRIDGHDIEQESLCARRSLGYLPESTPLYPELRVREYLSFRAAIKRVPRRRRAAAVDRALGLASLTDESETLILHLSKGYRQRVGIADALVASPPLLILDEPTIGLDPNQIRDLRTLIRSLGDRHTILLSTHILPEVEAICSRAIVIHRGRLVASGTIDELRLRCRSEGVSIEVRDPEGQASGVLEGVPGVGRVEIQSPSTLLVRFASDEADPGAASERAVSALCAARIGVRQVTPVQASLEDVFAELTRKEAAP